MHSFILYHKLYITTTYSSFLFVFYIFQTGYQARLKQKVDETRIELLANSVFRVMFKFPGLPPPVDTEIDYDDENTMPHRSVYVDIFDYIISVILEWFTV